MVNNISPTGKQSLNNWIAAKAKVDMMLFPNEVGEEKGRGSSHSLDRNTTHQLIDYELQLPTVMGYELIGSYNFCPICKKVRNKRLLLFNNKLNVVYEKWFVKHGQIVES